MIAYFSGTGNCRHIAGRIAEKTGEKAVSIEDRKTHFKLKEDESFGLVTPTHAWQLPALVRAFLQRLTLELCGENYVFTVVTYGSTPGCVGQDARRELKKRGIEMDAAFSLQMPDTWTPIFDLSDGEKVEKKNEDADLWMCDVITRIKSRDVGDYTERRAPLASRLITDRVLDKMRRTENFHVEDSCIGCGLCERRCPVRAIELSDDGKPVWVKEKCTVCLRCLHFCPKFAIQYGDGKTKKHGQYRHPGGI